MENDFIVCQKCGTQNASTNNFCQKCAAPLKENIPPVQPQYQQPTYQQQGQQSFQHVQLKPPVPKKKLKWWQLVLVCIGAFILLCAFIGAIGDNLDSTSKTSSTSSSKTASVKSTPTIALSPTIATPTEAPKLKKIGETAEYKGVKITVLDVNYHDGSQYIKPEAGQKFLSVNIQIENATSNKLGVNSLYFKIQTSNGEILDYDFSASVADSEKKDLKPMDLAPGGKTTGIVSFQVPKDDNNLILNYQDNIFSSKEKIQISLAK